MHFNSMPVSIRGVIYPSHKDAAKALGVTPAAISQRLRMTGSADTIGLGLAGGVSGNKNAAKPLTIFGMTFESRSQAAKNLGVARGSLSRWISPKASDAEKQILLAVLMKYKMQCENAWRDQLPQAASSLRISAAPVSTDKSPPSRANAAA